MADRYTDDDLMRLCATGDLDAFDVLFARHHAAVYNYARLMVGGSAQAEDMLQQTFLRVLDAASHYECRGRFRAWLMRVCRNECLRFLSAARIRERVVADSGFELLHATDGDDWPSAVCERTDTLRRVEDALARIPQSQREAILLHAVDGLRYQDIAEVKGPLKIAGRNG
jgi:RNA polymerase sigma-70 factor (ECF subfamily)